MNLTKIIVAVVILLTIVLLISTNCKTKENKDECASDRNLNRPCSNDSDCGKDGWCNENCDNKCFKKKKSGWGCSRYAQCDNSSYCKKEWDKTPKCAEKLDNGKSCFNIGANFSQCKSGCCSSDSNTCKEHGKKEKGESCGDDCECKRKSCTYALFKGYTCD